MFEKPNIQQHNSNGSNDGSVSSFSHFVDILEQILGNTSLNLSIVNSFVFYSKQINYRINEIRRNNKKKHESCERKMKKKNIKGQVTSKRSTIRTAILFLNSSVPDPTSYYYQSRQLPKILVHHQLHTCIDFEKCHFHYQGVC